MEEVQNVEKICAGGGGTGMRMRRIWPVFYLTLSTILVIGGVLWAKQPPKQLSEAEIAELRKEYPVHEDYFNQLIGPIRIPMERWTLMMDSVVYGEVVGGGPHYPTIRVIQDTEGMFRTGDEVQLLVGADFLDNCAALEIGTRIVVPVSNRNAGGKISYYREAAYYVTEKGYLLSVYPEEAFAEPSFTGRTLEDYLGSCWRLKHFPSREMREKVDRLLG